MWGRECMRNVNKESSCFDSSSGLGVGDWNVYPNGEASSMGDSCRFVFFIRIQNVNAILNILGARSIDCLTCNRLLTELSKHSNAAVPQAFLSFQPLPLPLRSLRTQSLLTIPSRPPPSLVSMPASP